MIEPRVIDAKRAAKENSNTHNLINTGTEPLKLFTVYSPPQHAAGTVHATKMEADAAEKEHLAKPDSHALPPISRANAA